ncbi:BTB/POZ domain-containing protein 17 [Astyanax mexicanus]|uniref:BTB domain containing 17 n=1 Tax=Astyanax mexicanus TaxID=7994 RepID=A0A8B9JFH0_ASTMX|nr:BTB/POZ domain-containing protein 17 [Astyanax mexicanus]
MTCVWYLPLLPLLLSAGLQIRPLSGGLVKVEEELESSAVISHSLGLMGRLEKLLLQGNSSDVSLRVETVDGDEVKLFQAHSLVLSLQSPALGRILQNRNSSTLVLQESSDCVAVFEKFIRYLYCGELSVNLDQATALHKLAAKYGVANLQQGLAEYMSQNLAGASASRHVVGWYEYAAAAGDAGLRDTCLQFLSWNLSAVLQSARWPAIGAELLMALLRRSDLVLQSELELFQGLEVWLIRNDPDSLTAENALRAVRYAMIPPRELFQLQRNSPVLRRYHESVRDLLYLSFQFHSASPVQLAKFFDVNCSLFVPRNYLAASWGTAWAVNNPARDDRSISFQSQLGPSGHDEGKRVTWNALFSPRWLPLSLRPMYNEPGAMHQSQTAQPTLGAARPRIIITPTTSSAEFAGVNFQKTVVVSTRQQGQLVVRHVYNFHQSTEETGDFLSGVDLQQRTSEYLADGSLHMHVIIKPLYQTLIAVKKTDVL